MKQELIGKNIKVLFEKEHVGMVCDETKNMICIVESGKKKWFIKRSVMLEVDGQKINGKTIEKRPEDRIKM